MAADPFLLLPDEVLRHIDEFEPIFGLAATSKSSLERVESFAECKIRRRAEGPGVEANWIVRLEEYCGNELRPASLPPGIEATVPWRLKLRAVKSVPLSEYVFQLEFGLVQIQENGTLVSVSNGQRLRVFDTAEGAITRDEQLPWIPQKVMEQLGEQLWFSTVSLYSANEYMVLRHEDSDSYHQHTIYAWPLREPEQKYEINLSEMFEGFECFSSAVTADGKLVVIAYNYLSKTGGKVVCVDVATGLRRNHPTQDLHQLFEIPADEQFSYVGHQLMTINDHLFLLRYSTVAGPNLGSTGVYLLKFNEGGSSLSVGSFQSCFEGSGFYHFEGSGFYHQRAFWWSKNNDWLVYRSHETDNTDKIKALRLAGGRDGGDGHIIPFQGDRKKVLLVVGGRLIAEECYNNFAEEWGEHGEIKLDEVCIRTGKVLRTIALGCSRDEYFVLSVVATDKDRLICILSKRHDRVPAETVIKTFSL